MARRDRPRTKMCHHRTLPLGLSKRCLVKGSAGFLAIPFYALVVEVTLVARGVDGFSCHKGLSKKQETFKIAPPYSQTNEAGIYLINRIHQNMNQ